MYVLSELHYSFPRSDKCGCLLLRTDDVTDSRKMEMYGVVPDFKNNLVVASAN